MSWLLFGAYAFLWLCPGSGRLSWATADRDVNGDGGDNAAVAADDYYRSEGDDSCDFYQLIEPSNRSYYMYLPGYPDPYKPDAGHKRRECRWFAKTPSFSDRLVLDCHEFDLAEASTARQIHLQGSLRQWCASDSLLPDAIPQFKKIFLRQDWTLLCMVLGFRAQQNHTQSYVFLPPQRKRLYTSPL